MTQGLPGFFVRHTSYLYANHFRHRCRDAQVLSRYGKIDKKLWFQEYCSRCGHRFNKWRKGDKRSAGGHLNGKIYMDRNSGDSRQ